MVAKVQEVTLGSLDAWGLGRAVAIDQVQVRLEAPNRASSTVANAAKS